MSYAIDALKLSPRDLARKIAPADVQRFFVGLVRGSLQVELYIPHGEDFQNPHDRDECYIITRGEGQFDMDGTVVDVVAGDFLGPSDENQGS